MQKEKIKKQLQNKEYMIYSNQGDWEFYVPKNTEVVLEKTQDSEGVFYTIYLEGELRCLNEVFCVWRYVPCNEVLLGYAIYTLEYTWKEEPRALEDFITLDYILEWGVLEGFSWKVNGYVYTQCENERCQHEWII